MADPGKKRIMGEGKGGEGKWGRSSCGCSFKLFHCLNVFFLNVRRNSMARTSSVKSNKYL